MKLSDWLVYMQKELARNISADSYLVPASRILLVIGENNQKVKSIGNKYICLIYIILGFFKEGLV